MDYMGIFTQITDGDLPPRPILWNDDGLHCSDCRRESEVDNHDCNVCSRNWGATNCRVHTEWHPK